MVCGKKFKSEKRWKNHEQSKKHKDKVAEFRDSLVDEEDFDDEALEVEVVEGNVEGGVRTDVDEIEAKNQKSTGVDDLEDRIRDGLNVADEHNGGRSELSDEDNTVFMDFEDDTKVEDRMAESLGDAADGDEEEDTSILQDMVDGHKMQKKARSFEAKADVMSSQVTNNDENAGDEYNNIKGTRRNRRAKKDKGTKDREETSKAVLSGNHKRAGTNGTNGSVREEISSQNLTEADSDGKENKLFEKHMEIVDQPLDRKDFAKDKSSKANKSPKGRRAEKLVDSSSAVC